MQTFCLQLQTERLQEFIHLDWSNRGVDLVLLLLLFYHLGAFDCMQIIELLILK